MQGRDIYFANNTSKLLKQVFPSDFKMVKDKTSNGYKLSNILYGAEVDIIWDQINSVYTDNYLDSLDYSEDPDVAIVYLDVAISGNTLWGQTDYRDSPITVTNKRVFETGKPTRLSAVGTLTISGVNYGYVGLEYFRSDRRGNGYILTSLNEDAATLYAAAESGVHKITSDSVGEFQTWNYSGENPIVLEQSYASVGRYEIISPLTSLQLEQEYPLTLDIRAPQGGVLGATESTYTIDHYTPYNGYYWDSVASTYKAVGYPTDKYYDKIDLVKKYYRTALNNPFGSGNYTTIYSPLEQVPISGTLKVYDIDNLDSEGNAIEIPQTGKNVYYYNGIYQSGVLLHTPDYLGYSQNVPPEMTADSSVTPTGYLYSITSWDYCRESGGLGEDLVWTEVPNNLITNRIKIINPYSRYMVEYKYFSHNKIKFISSTISTPYVRLQDNNYLYTVEDTDSNLELTKDFQFSRDPRPDRIGLTFDGWKYRPGSTIGKVQVNLDLSTTSDDLTDNVVLPLDQEPIGYTFATVPNRNDSKITFINEVFDGSNSFTLLNSGGSTTNLINYDTYYGTRMQYNSIGDLYYYASGFYDCRNQVAGNIRSIDLSFKFYTNPTSDIVLAQSSNGTDFWRITLKSNGTIQIDDPDYSLYSYNKITHNTSNYRIIVQRDIQYERGLSDTMFRLYVKTNNSIFKEFPLTLKDISNSVPVDIRTSFFINSSLDIKSAKIYEEPKGYIEWPSTI